MPASPTAEVTASGKPFVLLVSLVGGKPIPYQFDQSRVLVGRGIDADLRIEHAGVSRWQFLVERGLGSMGEARFRITPYEATNATYVNDRPAVEGTIVPGDVVAVADVRVTLERKIEKGARKKKQDLPPARMLLLTGVVGMALFVGYLFFGGGEEDDAGELATAQTRLFAAMPELRCGNPVECDTRAHDAYTRAKKLLSQAGADPGNLYRATLEFDKASRFRDQSGRPLPDMADVGALEDQARARAEAEFADAKFRLQRAMAAGDAKRCAVEAAALAHIVPDERHPYRVKLDAYRRALPKPKEKGIGE
ncbi:MAG: Inner rane component of cytoplasmic domain [Myxococcales bacterium]|nr:Inner rane component of cytoplasmic domain [Myxococcales bacterium]